MTLAPNWRYYEGICVQRLTKIWKKNSSENGWSLSLDLNVGLRVYEEEEEEDEDGREGDSY
jgi:hypothetical protein